MDREVGVLVTVAVAICCLFRPGLCQDPTDIHHGCYFDGVDRVLTDLITCTDGADVCHASCGMEHRYCQSNDGMTIDFCRMLCSNRNLQYYALEAGSQCYCGGALSNPFREGNAAGVTTNCSVPCTGDASQACGGDFKMQVYEFQDPVPGANCFHPGFVPNAYVSDDLVLAAGDKVTFLCVPRHRIIGDAELTCHADGSWTPNVLPVCNYTGILETTMAPQTTEPNTTPNPTTDKITTAVNTGKATVYPRTTQPNTIPNAATDQIPTAVSARKATVAPRTTRPNTTPNAATNQIPTAVSAGKASRAPQTTEPNTTPNAVTDQNTTAAKPLTTVTDFLPYIIGASGALVFILVVCMVGIFVCRKRKQAGNARQDIRLKPDAAPVTFINRGFHGQDEEESKVDMPDILSTTANPPAHTTVDNDYHHRMSTFSEDPVYQNGAHAVSANGTARTTYANVSEDEKEPLSPKDNPPSPIYANAEAALPNGTDRQQEYARQHSGSGQGSLSSYPGSASADDPTSAASTGNRRAKKNASGTKDLVGWSRPSSLYQRTALDDLESDEDNTSIDPNDLSSALYAQVDKSRPSDSIEGLDTLGSQHSGNSFFADPTKSSATRL